MFWCCEISNYFRKSLSKSESPPNSARETYLQWFSTPSACWLLSMLAWNGYCTYRNPPGLLICSRNDYSLLGRSVSMLSLLSLPSLDSRGSDDLSARTLPSHPISTRGRISDTGQTDATTRYALPTELAELRSMLYLKRFIFRKS